MLNNEQKENLKRECENINNKIYDKKFYDIVFKYHENFLTEKQVKDLIGFDKVTLEGNILKAEIKPINTTLSLNVDEPVSIKTNITGFDDLTLKETIEGITKIIFIKEDKAQKKFGVSKHDIHILTRNYVKLNAVADMIVIMLHKACGIHLAKYNMGMWKNWDMN